MHISTKLFFAFYFSYFIVYYDVWSRKYLQKCVTINHSFMILSFFLIDVQHYVHDFIPMAYSHGVNS